MLFFLLFSTTCAEFSQQNRNETLCSNGVVPVGNCSFVPTSGYECSDSSVFTSWCENFNGTYKCCQKPPKTCHDRSKFCHNTKHLCKSKKNFKTMKSVCEATCGFCDIQNFEQVLNSTTEGPRKCVFPKSLMLNNTDNSTKTLENFIVVKKSVGMKRDNLTVIETPKMVNLTTLLHAATTSTTLKTRSTTTTTTTKTTTATHPNESLKKYTTERNRNITSTITLPKQQFKSAELTSDQLLTTKDDLPQITKSRPSSFTNSLKKTVIQGTCFDEYMYCREFSSLCSHSAFSEAMASHCSLTCDRCSDVKKVEKGVENCADSTPECDSYKDLCNHSKYTTLMKNYCPKSCGLCVPLCRDRHQNCPQFAEDGFCSDAMYTSDEKKFLCGSTCKLC